VQLKATYIGDLAFWSSTTLTEYAGMQRPIPG
jgi:hypothetical protein